MCDIIRITQVIFYTQKRRKNMMTYVDVMAAIIHKIDDTFGYTVIRSELKPDIQGKCSLYLVYHGMLNYDQLEELFKIAHIKHTIPGRLPAVQTNCSEPAGAYSITLQLSNLDFAA